MDKTRYFNQLLYRMEEVFFHELSECAFIKTEYVGSDFIQTQNVKGTDEDEVIRSCIDSIKSAGIAEDITYSIGGKGILLKLKVKGCQHILKEQLLREAGIKPYNCVIANMILDQIIAKLKYTTTYVARLDVDENTHQCGAMLAIYATPEKVGEISDWSQE